MQGAPPPSPALAEAVRAGRWAEVRTLTASEGRPLPPLLALVAGRAARSLGEPARALDLLRSVLARAGELGAAVRLECAEAALALGQDPWPYLAPLLADSSPTAHRNAAAAVLRAAWETTPLPALRRVPRRALPSTLRRALAMTVAVRDSDEAEALHVLAERVSDEAGLQAARWLAGRSDLPPTTRLAVVEALLSGGAWREADELLSRLPPPGAAERFRFEFLSGRAAYRLGEFPRASEAFDRALTVASSDVDRFEAAVQRARVAEVSGDLSAALAYWDRARAARPREVEGWDGATRLRVALGLTGEALELVKRCPASALRTAGPRLAAMLLIRGDPAGARIVLDRVPHKLPVARALTVALLGQTGDLEAARTASVSLLTDPRAGPWRESVFDLLPANAFDAEPAPPSRDLRTLARLAVRSGAVRARESLRSALTSDPSWAPVLAGPPRQPNAWIGPASDLVSVGLERDAATLYPHAFPGASPEEEAWSARTLAAWGNAPSALSAGERLWGQLGSVPAVLLPNELLSAILPAELVNGCVLAAKEEAVPPEWLVGIIRQESRFDVNAYSFAGAVGVAQIVPESARRLGATPAELREGDRALHLAAREVSRLVGRFGRRLVPVAASYNAGEAVVASWLAEFGPQPEEALLIAAIPYRETATYALAVRQGVELSRYLEEPGEAR